MPRRRRQPTAPQRQHTPKQKRQAEHIEDTYAERGVPPGVAESIAWATVNKHRARKPKT